MTAPADLLPVWLSNRCCQPRQSEFPATDRARRKASRPARLENPPHLDERRGSDSGIEHRVQVITTASNVASANGICSAEALTKESGTSARAARLRRHHAAIRRKGLDRQPDETAGPYRERFSPETDARFSRNQTPCRSDRASAIGNRGRRCASAKSRQGGVENPFLVKDPMTPTG